MRGLFRKRRRVGPESGTAISAVQYAVIDTELTGLDELRDDIVSFGAVHMTGGRIELGDAFYRLARPERQLSRENVVIHEITPSDVEDERSVGAVLAEFLDYCGERVLVGHFTAIDLAFLERDAKRYRGAAIANPVIDTYSIYQWLCRRHLDHPCLASPETGRKLADIARCFGILMSTEHNAVIDAYTTAQLFQRFIPLLRSAGVLDIGDLLHLGVPFKGGDGFGPTGEIANF